MTLMPWVLYHISEIQTQFMWSTPERTRHARRRAAPAAERMFDKQLGMHKKWEVASTTPRPG
jgi:hypothetical protein